MFLMEKKESPKPKAMKKQEVEKCRKGKSSVASIPKSLSSAGLLANVWCVGIISSPTTEVLSPPGMCPMELFSQESMCSRLGSDIYL